MVALSAFESDDGNAFLNVRGLVSVDDLRSDLRNVAERLRARNGATGCKPSDLGYQDPPAKTDTIGTVTTPPAFRRWYVYKGRSEGNEVGYPVYSNYNGYPDPYNTPSRSTQASPQNKRATDPPDTSIPRAIPVMTATTGIHGGGIPRALIPNPDNPALRRRRALYVLATFRKPDPNGGCARNGSATPNDWDFTNFPDLPEPDGQKNRDLATATWSLVGFKTSKGIQSLIGYMPNQTRSPYERNPDCRTGYIP